MRWIFAGLLLLSILDTAEACQIPKYQWSDAYTSTVKITVYRNQTNCSSSMWTAGVAIKTVRIARNPSHGRAGVLRLSTWAYQPDPDFVGQDEFTVAIDYEKRGTLGKIVTAILNIEVTVQPRPQALRDLMD